MHHAWHACRSGSHLWLACALGTHTWCPPPVIPMQPACTAYWPAQGSHQKVYTSSRQHTTRSAQILCATWQACHASWQARHVASPADETSQILRNTLLSLSHCHLTCTPHRTGTKKQSCRQTRTHTGPRARGCSSAAPPLAQQAARGPGTPQAASCCGWVLQASADTSRGAGAERCAGAHSVHAAPCLRLRRCS